MFPIFDNWLFWALLAAVFAALTAILGKVGVIGISSDFATFYRTLIVAAALALLLLATGQMHWPQEATSRTYLFLTLSGLATGASWLCYYRALQMGQASQVAPIDKLSIVLVAIFGVVFLHEKLSTLNWLGIAMIGSGALLAAWR